MTFRMGDAIIISNLPQGLDAYAGYVGGRWPTYTRLADAFPGAKYLSIAVHAGLKADCLDIEAGDARPSDVPAWLAGWTPGNTTKPVLYTSASNVQAVIDAAAHPRSEYLIWSAHYGPTSHICAPEVCRYPQADGTQWTDHGGVWDESLLADHFFAAPAAPIRIHTPAPEVPDMIAPPCTFVMDAVQQAFYVDSDGRLQHHYQRPGKAWVAETIGAGWAVGTGLAHDNSTGVHQVWGVMAGGRPAQCYWSGKAWTVQPL